MADNTTINPGVGGDVIRDINRAGVKTQVVQLDFGGEAGPESLVTTGNGMPISLVSTGFTFSAAGQNSSTTQLAAGATFTGTVESITSQQALSFCIFSDQPSLLTINQYADAAGTQQVSSWSFQIAANTGFNRSFTANGNYHQLVFTNQGSAATTLLNINTAYGTIPPSSNLGNLPVALNEIAGVAVASGSLPVSVQGTPTVAEVYAAAATTSDNPFFAAITGDPSGDFAGVNLIEQVMTDGSGLQFNVKLVNPVKLDAVGAGILSDAPAPIQINGAVNQFIVIDTTGYQSLNITTQTLAANVFASNDGITWSVLTGAPLVLGAMVTAVAANTSYSFPCIARYIRFTPTTAGTATIYLRAQPWNGSYTVTVPTGVAQNNIAQYGGSAVVNGGLAGVISVGGNVAAGVAPTVNAVMVGGIDTSGLTRRALTDTSGRLNVGDFAIDFTGAVRQMGIVAPGQTTSAALQVVDAGQTEGQGQAEILLQLLQEMRITNAQLYLLNTQGGASPSDDPGSMRADPTFFIQ